jgi:hypothetical protein
MSNELAPLPETSAVLTEPSEIGSLISMPLDCLRDDIRDNPYIDAAQVSALSEARIATSRVEHSRDECSALR